MSNYEQYKRARQQWEAYAARYKTDRAGARAGAGARYVLGWVVGSIILGAILWAVTGGAFGSHHHACPAADPVAILHQAGAVAGVDDNDHGSCIYDADGTNVTR